MCSFEYYNSYQGTASGFLLTYRGASAISYLLVLGQCVQYSLSVFVWLQHVLTMANAVGGGLIPLAFYPSKQPVLFDCPFLFRFTYFREFYSNPCFLLKVYQQNKSYLTIFLLLVIKKLQ